MEEPREATAGLWVGEPCSLSAHGHLWLLLQEGWIGGEGGLRAVREVHPSCPVDDRAGPGRLTGNCSCYEMSVQLGVLVDVYDPSTQAVEGHQSRLALAIELARSPSPE